MQGQREGPQDVRGEVRERGVESLNGWNAHAAGKIISCVRVVGRNRSLVECVSGCAPHNHMFAVRAVADP